MLDPKPTAGEKRELQAYPTIAKLFAWLGLFGMGKIPF